MKTSELQLGDYVSCLGSPMIVVSLSLNGDEPIGIMSPLKKIFTFMEKDVYPIILDESMLMQNNFNPEIVSWWRPKVEDFFKIAIMNNDTSLCAKVKYVHELQHALRLCGLSELAENLKVLQAVMRRTKLVEMIPLDAPSECQYNCVGCEHLKGVVYYGNDDVEVECDIDEEDRQ